jgi:hypothetical protein
MRMSTYRINPVGGSGGFKVQVTDSIDGLRVVGVFLTEDDANAWIDADGRMAQPTDCEAPPVFFRQEQKTPPHDATGFFMIRSDQTE